MALYFSGSSGNYAEITGGYGNTLSNTAGMISLWLKPIYDFGIAVSTKGLSASGLFIETNNSAGTMLCGINNSYPTVSNAGLASDTWVFLAIGGNSTSNLANAMVYVNAEQVHQHIATSAWISSAANLYLGRFDGGTFPYKGWIGDIRVWNRRLTPAEVLAVYRNQDVTSGLVERWPLTESSGSTITGTVAGLNGTISGTPTWGGTSIPYGIAPATGKPQHPMYQQVIG